MGQLLLEDEYVINVKVRRPIDGFCPPPPTFTVACHDSNQPITSQKLIGIQSNELTNHDAEKNNGYDPNGSYPQPSNASYIGAFTIGPDQTDETEIYFPNKNVQKSIEWNNPDNSYAKRHDFSKKETSVTMLPGDRKFYPQYYPCASVGKCPLDSGSLKSLPQVRVFGDDETLLATNIFKNPEERRVAHVPENRTCNGSLYVERHKDHCQSTNGQLYVPPVSVSKLKQDEDNTPMRGNSRRTETERINAKLNKKLGFTPTVLKCSEYQNAILARERVSEMLESRITPPMDKKFREIGPQDSSHVYFENNETSDHSFLQLRFPSPVNCLPHACPRNRQLESSVFLTQSSTMFPSSPSTRLSSQSFNYPSGRTSCSSNYPQDSDFTDCDPCYPIFFDVSCPRRSTETSPSSSAKSYAMEKYNMKENELLPYAKDNQRNNTSNHKPETSHAPSYFHNYPSSENMESENVFDDRTEELRRKQAGEFIGNRLPLSFRSRDQSYTSENNLSSEADWDSNESQIFNNHISQKTKKQEHSDQRNLTSNHNFNPRNTSVKRLSLLNENLRQNSNTESVSDNEPSLHSALSLHQSSINRQAQSATPLCQDNVEYTPRQQKHSQFSEDKGNFSSWSHYPQDNYPRNANERHLSPLWPPQSTNVRSSGYHTRPSNSFLSKGKHLNIIVSFIVFNLCTPANYISYTIYTHVIHHLIVCNCILLFYLAHNPSVISNYSIINLFVEPLIINDYVKKNYYFNVEQMR